MIGCLVILEFGGLFFILLIFFVFQPGFVAFMASVAFVGVWLLWLYHALPIYLIIYLINYLSNLT